MKIFNNSYDILWKAIIRPTRDNYQDKDLGPEKFEINGKFYKRTDLCLLNKRNHKLQCSFWEPFDEEREYPYLPCVIYLHGNSSSRCEAVAEIRYLLSLNMTVFAFDFSGCGRSEGEYISLGYYEKFDVECVVEFLRKSKKVSTIGIWGRSMGAVTAILFCGGEKGDSSIGGIVLDSAFCSLMELIFELAKKKVNLPDFIIKEVADMVKNTIKEKANFLLEDIEPKKFAKKCFIPALFCHAKNDSFVNIHHCKDLYDNYAGDKKILYVNGNHNSTRPKYFRELAADFLYNTLGCKFLKQLCDNCDGKKFNLNSDNNSNDMSRQGLVKQNDSSFCINNVINSNNNNENNNNNNDTNIYEDKIFQKALELTAKEFEELKSNKPKNFINNKLSSEDINDTPKSKKLNNFLCNNGEKNSISEKKVDVKKKIKNKNNKSTSNDQIIKLDLSCNFDNKNNDDMKIIRNAFIQRSFKLETNLKKCNWKKTPILMKIISPQKKYRSLRKISYEKKIKKDQNNIALKKNNKKKNSIQNLLNDFEILPSNLVKFYTKKRKNVHHNSFDIKEKMKNLFINENTITKKRDHSLNKKYIMDDKKLILDDINLVPVQNHDDNEKIKESNEVETVGKDSIIKIDDNFYFKCKIENECKNFAQ